MPAVGQLVKKPREDGYLLYNLTKDVSHCKKEWLPGPFPFIPLPEARCLCHPPGYATLVKYLGTTAGLVGKTTSTGEEGGGGGRGGVGAEEGGQTARERRRGSRREC